MASRAKRYRALKSAGFLVFEARQFTSTSRITASGKRIKVKPLPLSVPYIKEMIRERGKEHRQAMKAGVTQAEWTEKIKERYDEEDWFETSGKHRA